MQSMTLHPSRLQLHTICPASTIPALHPIATTSPEATLGTALHHLAASMVTGLHLEAADVARQYGVDAEELEILGRCAWRVWEQLREHFPMPRVEEPLEWSGALGRTLKGRVDLLSLAYTSDANLWASDMPSEARILDWKTTRDSDTDYDAQVRGYAYLTCRRWPTVRRVYAVLAWVREQSWEAQYFHRDDLERWWIEFCQRLERTPLPANPGRWCGYCPRALECPQRQQLLAAVVDSLLPEDDGSSRFDQMVAALGPAPDRGHIYRVCLDQMKLLEGHLEAARAAIRAEVTAAGGSLSAGEGYELRLVEQKRRTILPREAWGELSVILHPDRLMECVTIHKIKVEQAVREQVPEDAPRGAKKEAVEELHRRLEEAGAWSVQVVERLELKRLFRELEQHEQ